MRARTPWAWAVGAVIGASALSGCQPPDTEQVARPGTETGPEHAGTSTSTQAGAPVPTLTPVVIAEHDHDTGAFTQGLEIMPDGQLLESTGGYGTSSLRLGPLGAAPQTTIALDEQLFGEGATFIPGQDGTPDRIYQLTWQQGVVKTWTYQDGQLSPTEPLSIAGQGWGLCYDAGNNRLIRSDGTSTLTFHDTDTMAVLGSVQAHLPADGGQVRNLNELECVDGHLWANIWKSDVIVAIDVQTGMIVGRVDASGLTQRAQELADAPFSTDEVLNGIAHDASSDRWLLTGKQWPVLFEVELDTAALLD